MTVATTLKDFLATVTQAQYLAQLMDGHKANTVPVASWTSPRNTGLSLTQIGAQFFAALRGLLGQGIAGVFLDYAAGLPLTLFAQSQYRLDRVPAQFTSGQLTLTSVATAPAYTFAAGDLTAGTPGPETQNSRYFSNVETGSLQVGQLSAPLLGQGLTIARKATGVSVEVRVQGTSTPLSVPALGAGVKAIVVHQATDAAGNAIGSSAQIKAAMDGEATVLALVQTSIGGAGSAVVGTIAPTSLDVGTLILGFQATQPGAGWNVPTGSPLDTKTSYAGVSVANPAWQGGSWITSQGAEEEDDARLKLRCASRWATIGVAGNEEAALFWALQIPNGYSASPVSHAQVLSNYLNGTHAGAGCTVLVIGPAGALGPGDVAAVQANFDAPISSMAASGIPGLDTLGKKYPLGVQLQVISGVNRVITLTGMVSIFRRAGVTIAEVQAAVTAELARYQSTLRIGQQIFPRRKVAGVIESSPPFSGAIRDVDLSSMQDVITPLVVQYPLLDASGLTYQLVDG